MWNAIHGLTELVPPYSGKMDALETIHQKGHWTVRFIAIVFWLYEQLSRVNNAIVYKLTGNARLPRYSWACSLAMMKTSVLECQDLYKQLIWLILWSDILSFVLLISSHSSFGPGCQDEGSTDRGNHVNRMYLPK